MDMNIKWNDYPYIFGMEKQSSEYLREMEVTYGLKMRRLDIKITGLQITTEKIMVTEGCG